MIKEYYVNFEISKLLKEKGFDWECACINNPQCGMSLLGRMINNTGLQLTREADLCIDRENLITIPTLQMAIKWIRESFSLYIDIELLSGPSFSWYIFLMNDPKYMMGCSEDTTIHYYNSYEEACEAAIKYCLENLI